MIPTVPIDILLNVGLGSTVALAGRGTLADQGLLRTASLWAVIALQLLLFVPVGAYLLIRFPAWSLMYLVDAGSLPMADVWLVVLYPVAAIGGYLGTRQLLLKDKLWPAVGIAAGSLALSAAVVWFGRAQLLALGSTQAFRSAPDTMRETIGSELSIVVAAAGVAITVSWGATLWRLIVLGRAVKPMQARSAATQIKPVEGNKGKGTRKAGKNNKKAS